MKATIMVVDDDSMFRDLLTYGLEHDGYEVVTATNGSDATAILAKSRPDAIIVDMMMPVMDGLKFLVWLKEKTKLQIPTLLLTCLDDRALFVDGLVAGAADVILKPVGLDVILEKLSSILGGQMRAGGPPEAEDMEEAQETDLAPEV